jgi:type IV pilus biogenesis protein CpaD/CtpE
MKKLTILASVPSVVALMLLVSCASKSETTTVNEPAATRPTVPMAMQPPNAKY